MSECHDSPYDNGLYIRSLVQITRDSERKSYWPFTDLLIMMLKRDADNAILLWWLVWELCWPSFKHQTWRSNPFLMVTHSHSLTLSLTSHSHLPHTHTYLTLTLTLHLSAVKLLSLVGSYGSSRQNDQKHSRGSWDVTVGSSRPTSDAEAFDQPIKQRQKNKEKMSMTVKHAAITSGRHSDMYHMYVWQVSVSSSFIFWDRWITSM